MRSCLLLHTLLGLANNHTMTRLGMPMRDALIYHQFMDCLLD